ncbi:hypothetical protein Aph02nite_45050 [Actinoplanes philippinensis]|uniref:5-methyltetrahydropteroyltriglutamate--homocysteine methyltransferase n=1 Tax=Actinoplanes philippinensis TaxID=35752 RepID=A0A1I2I8J3_9ACTN|nr:hypothetical protein [Actinoplanes philippinensis]GIE78555.1 hypothetical protein Aph02nite_45050 [Actinoplanes philippinensis]SFF37978.1 hypothetical protein SAMN05421541_109373 [Actinoplanes philippinensis]
MTSRTTSRDSSSDSDGKATTRRAHLVGSFPADDAAEAMRIAATRLGADLDYLPDGETGDRRSWITTIIDGFRHHPALDLVRTGDWSSYQATPRYRVRRGGQLTAETIDLGIAAAAEASLPAYHAQRATTGGPRFQVGVPGALDLAMFTFGPAGMLRYADRFAGALAREMREVHATTGGDVLFQIEIPVELILLTRMPAPARKPLARWLATRVTALALAAPAGAEFGVHLCLGDLNHRALGALKDAGPVVDLANALAARWPADRPLRYLHGPLAAADNPPADDPAFYRPLRDLSLGGARFVAGYAHEKQDLHTQQRIRGYVEDALGAPADVSTSCGLGRRDQPSAVAALDRIKELLYG